MNIDNLPLANKRLWIKQDGNFFEEFDIMNDENGLIKEYFYRLNMSPTEYVHGKNKDENMEGIYMIFNNL